MFFCLQGRDSSLPGTFPPPQTATAARGLAALHITREGLAALYCSCHICTGV